jgi:hypothetical protein
MESDGRSNTRIHNFKNKGIDSEELRRRREDESVQLRKQKREEHVMVYCLLSFIRSIIIHLIIVFCIRAVTEIFFSFCDI